MDSCSGYQLSSRQEQVSLLWTRLDGNSSHGFCRYHVEDIDQDESGQKQ